MAISQNLILAFSKCYLMEMVCRNTLLDVTNVKRPVLLSRLTLTSRYLGCYVLQSFLTVFDLALSHVLYSSTIGLSKLKLACKKAPHGFRMMI
jgi:hypothetical protein